MSRLLVGMATLAILVSVPGVVSAGSTTAPRVKIVRDVGAVTVSVQKDTLVVSQRLTPQAFDLTLARSDERVRFTGDVNGRVSVTRGRASHAFSMATLASGDLAAVRQIVSGSSALREFDHLMVSEWARTDKNAAVFASAHAIVALVQGKTMALRATVDRMGHAAEPRLMTVARQSSGECWGLYTRDVVRATFDLEACLEEARSSLNPFRTIWCSYSYNMRASLAFIWLLDCNGA